MLPAEKTVVTSNFLLEKTVENIELIPNANFSKRWSWAGNDNKNCAARPRHNHLSATIPADQPAAEPAFVFAARKSKPADFRGSTWRNPRLKDKS